VRKPSPAEIVFLFCILQKSGFITRTSEPETLDGVSTKNLRQNLALAVGAQSPVIWAKTA